MAQTPRARVIKIFNDGPVDYKLTRSMEQNADLIIKPNGDTQEITRFKPNGKEVDLHVLPAAILDYTIHPMCLLGEGVVFDPSAMVSEIHHLESAGFKAKNKLLISGRATVVTPYHYILEEQKLGDKAGADRRGSRVGIALADRVNGLGICAYDLIGSEEHLINKILRALEYHKPILKTFKKLNTKDLLALATQYTHSLKAIASNFEFMIVDENAMIQHYLEFDDLIVVENTSLPKLHFFDDSNEGRVPFDFRVDSRLEANETVLVTESFASKEGTGKLPTAPETSENQEMQEFFGGNVNKYDVPKTYGYFDACIVKRLVQETGANYLYLKGLDKIGEWGMKNGHIKVAYAYQYDGREISSFPDDLEVTGETPTPKYIDITAGWELTMDMKKYDDLPEMAKYFIETIERFVGIPVKYIEHSSRDATCITRTDV